MELTAKCKYPPCTCGALPALVYCCEECAAADARMQTDTVCHCNHAHCGGQPETVPPETVAMLMASSALAEV